MKKICIITSTRADYGLLKPLIKELKALNKTEIKLLVTGTHLETAYGLTIDEINNDNLAPVIPVKIFKNTTKTGILDTMSNAIKRVGKKLDELKPDLVILLGDRYEIFAITSACVVLNIPTAHLYGGEITTGAIDDCFRHSITKMSNIHFTSCEQTKKRVIQLGEQPENVFNFGFLGIENIKNLKLLSKKEINERFSINIENTLLATFHPVTNETDTQIEQFKNLLEAIKEEKYFAFFTGSNADTNSKELKTLLNKYVKKYPNKFGYTENLGTINYLSMMKYAKCVIGNSSSGIYEAPSFKTPTINIGSRQNGRVQAKSVINCKAEKKDILKAINRLSNKEFLSQLNETTNLFEQKNTAKNIAKTIINFVNKVNTPKIFYDITIK